MSLSLEVRTLDGQRMPATAAPSDTVLALKQRLASQRSADGWCEEMNLSWQGKFLQDDLTLGASGLRDGDFVVATGLRPVVIAPPVEPDLEFADERYAVEERPQSELPSVCEMRRDE